MPAALIRYAIAPEPAYDYGGGTLFLTGANTYSGPTYIERGVLSVSSINSVSGGTSSSNLGATDNRRQWHDNPWPNFYHSGTPAYTGYAGTLQYTGTGTTTDRVIQLNGGSGGGGIDDEGTGTLFTNSLLSSSTDVGLAQAGTTLDFGTTPIAAKVITGASWANGVATITAANSYYVGQSVAINGMTPAGYNGIVTVATATSSNFTYNLTTIRCDRFRHHRPLWSKSLRQLDERSRDHYRGQQQPRGGRLVYDRGMTPAAYNGTYTVVTASG